MKSKSLKQKLVRFFKGKQGGAVPTAIKVLTAVVCGAVIMMGLYGVVTGVVLPASSDKVNSMFSYEAEGGAGGPGGGGGYGGGTGTPDAGETGLRFGKMYSGFGMGVIFFEDTSAEIYVNGSLVNTISAGTFEYKSDGVYDSNGLQYEITNGGKSLVTPSTLPDGSISYMTLNLEE